MSKIYEAIPIAQIYYNSARFKEELSSELYDSICLLRRVIKGFKIHI